ncbi:hypothetical protein BX616_007206 [Lobosporangium transversale]|uniref:F-box domain-containing protein n=1 Tax=Lobosporangium transversale TaxID=64571 RepID=A0A1Y2GI47_9FUNG|nr:hypothetical protein BCR41DRAFT_387824 [Lobosporangium transversale]KAF9896560.1 hypothetical protein BX616_007206 [Lobosporangium transversale]ORZ11386.1 hypothetical protein BCR41DRAFT_387824 [Lobosporangium transversale]|eukprot:XP_021879701.1 hypothetical protein BCR41DRAFT_387824 [Lobosporangium transversale]
MPHIIDSKPASTGPATAGIGIHATATASRTTIIAKHQSSSPLAKETPVAAASKTMDIGSESESESVYSLYTDDSELDETDLSSAESQTEQQQQQQQKQRRGRRRKGYDLFSQLPDTILQQILAYLPPFQMLTISELSRKFYNFVVLGQEMNEVWFRLVKHEEAEEKKRVEWYKQKRLEQEQRNVQMMRSFSNSSTGSIGSSFGEDSVAPLSKQAQRLLNKKQEAAGKSTGSSVKVMKRSDRKKNWCKIYVDSILRGNGESPLESLDKVVPGSAKKSRTFQTIILNEPLSEDHYREYQGGSSDDNTTANKEMSREAKTQAKIEKRMYYKMIRAKPKGKKAGQLDSAAAKADRMLSWKQQPEWSEQDQLGDY